MSAGLADRQLRSTDWNVVRSSAGPAGSVRENLDIFLSAYGHAFNVACRELEGLVSSQGHLFECAPAVVSVIVAALADDGVPQRKMGATLDLLGLILAGWPDDSEVALGNGDLDERCHREAMKGYWVLARLAFERDPYNAWQLARDLLDMLDPEHAAILLEK